MRELSIGVIEDLTPTLAPEQVDKLCRRGVQLTYGRNELIYRQGEPAGHVFLLLEGEAQSALRSSLGNETLLRIHLPGSILVYPAISDWIGRRRRSGRGVETTTP